MLSLAAAGHPRGRGGWFGSGLFGGIGCGGWGIGDGSVGIGLGNGSEGMGKGGCFGGTGTSGGLCGTLSRALSKSFDAELAIRTTSLAPWALRRSPISRAFIT